jgi:hypothetical protein
MCPTKLNPAEHSYERITSGYRAARDPVNGESRALARVRALFLALQIALDRSRALEILPMPPRACTSPAAHVAIA